MTLFGIMGLGHSVGTTHMAIMTAQYLAEVRQRKTAILEWNDSGDFGRIREVRQGKNVPDPGENSFSMASVRYYPGAGAETYLQCRECGYEAMVIDFGVYREEIFPEYLRCGRRFAVGGTSRWQLPFLAGFAAGAGRFRKVEYCAAFGGREAMDLAERYLRIRLFRIPFTEDPWVIGGLSMKFFGEALG